MARVGEAITSSRGERLSFQATAASTNGDLLCFEMYLPPTSMKPPPHKHPFQLEIIRVVAGEARATINGRTQTYTAGQTVTVSKGATHVVWNAGDRELHFVAELRPALKAEGFFEGLMRLESYNPLRLAVLIGAFKEEIRLSFPFNLGLHVMCALGRWAGYKV